jgi:hypothetical protein
LFLTVHCSLYIEEQGTWELSRPDMTSLVFYRLLRQLPCFRLSQTSYKIIVLTRWTEAWKPPKAVVTRGSLAKYSHLVGDASHGALTDLF